MHLVLDSGVARQKREKAFSGLLPDWDAARVARQAIGCGSGLFDLSLDVARRCRVDLERQTGATWFTRGVRDLLRAGDVGSRTVSGTVPSGVKSLVEELRRIENSYAGCATRDQLVMTTRASSARDAITLPQGAGIGVVLTVTGLFRGWRAPFAVDWRRPLEIGLADHPCDRSIPGLRHPVDRLAEAFNPAKFPWFKDEFVHPPGFKAVYMGKPLTHFFGGFLDEGR